MLDKRFEDEMNYEETLNRVLGHSDNDTQTKSDRKIYLYSSQALNFKVLAMKEMRERLGKVKGES